MTRLSAARETVAYYIARPLVQLLAKTPIPPNAVTWFGLLITIGAAVLIITEHLFAAGLLVLFAGVFDILDGALARATNRVTSFGGVLDSTLDRLSEAALLLGILGLFLLSSKQPFLLISLTQGWSVLIVFIALPSSQLVSYIRARAEAAGLECRVGFFTRPERVVVLVLGLLLNQILLALIIVAVLSSITVVQRLFCVWRQVKASS